MFCASLWLALLPVALCRNLAQGDWPELGPDHPPVLSHRWGTRAPSQMPDGGTRPGHFWVHGQTGPEWHAEWRHSARAPMGALGAGTTATPTNKTVVHSPASEQLFPSYSGTRVRGGAKEVSPEMSMGRHGCLEEAIGLIVKACPSWLANHFSTSRKIFA